MEITYDPTKDATNVARHGVSLALAIELEWESAVVWPDGRRIISLRKANQREVKRYAEA